jgi:RNA polymerase sigma-70 factor (ECF subfamily)
LTATRSTIGSCCEPGQAIWDGADAAQALGIAPGTVKSRTYYALRALRLAIEELRDVE